MTSFHHLLTDCPANHTGGETSAYRHATHKINVLGTSRAFTLQVSQTRVTCKDWIDGQFLKSKTWF